MTAPAGEPRTDGLPGYLLRLLDGAHDLPLARRMPRPSATARRSAVLILRLASAAVTRIQMDGASR